MSKILIIEDDQSSAEMLRDWLTHEMFTVDVVHTGEEGLYLSKNFPFDLIILDWGLPSISGIDIIRELRMSGRDIPILMLTARDDLTDTETGLNVGADDYVTKPFKVREVSARVRALLRRPSQFKEDILKNGPIQLDRSTRKLSVNGATVGLLPAEYALLEFLMRNPEQVFTVDDLLNNVWRADSEAGEMAVRTNITRLRKKLGAFGRIRTVHGMGYKLELTPE